MACWVGKVVLGVRAVVKGVSCDAWAIKKVIMMGLDIRPADYEARLASLEIH